MLCLTFFHQPFEVAQIFFDSAQQVSRIEDRTDLQSYFGFLFRTRLEGDHARYEVVRDAAPSDPATRNLKHDVKDSRFVFAVPMQDIIKILVINSSHLPK